MIDPNKTYRTRDGRPVRIYATDGVFDGQIHGAIKNGGWIACQWDQEGRFDGACCPTVDDWLGRNSLVEVTLADELRDQIPWEAIRDGYKFVAADRHDDFVTWHAHSHPPEPKNGEWFCQGIKEPLRAIKMPHVMGERWRETLIERPEDR